MQTRHILGTVALALGLAFGPAAFAKEGNATKDDAVATVKKGIAFIKANGKDKGYAEVSNKEGQFIDRDLYLVVYGLDGTVRAHGANGKMVGKNLIDLKDNEGKAIVKSLITTANTPAGRGWVDFKWPNPLTKVVEQKSGYIERVDNMIVGSGIYK